MTGSHGARRKPGATSLTEDGCHVTGPSPVASPPLYSPVDKDAAWGDVLDSPGGQYDARWAQPGF
jgi:hypothetical protein